MKHTLEEIGVTPVGYDKHGPKYAVEHLDRAVLGMIKNGTYFTWRYKATMKKDYDEASELLKQSEQAFANSLHKFQDRTLEVGEGVKKSTGQIRDAVHKLNDGLARAEKVANFDRMERFVELLERAESAMQGLAELEQSGKLAKISQAIK